MEEGSRSWMGTWRLVQLVGLSMRREAGTLMSGRELAHSCLMQKDEPCLMHGSQSPGQAASQPELVSIGIQS